MVISDQLKVFISYSRKDTAFAEELASGLQLAGNFEILIDRSGIGHGEEWRTRLGELILRCDTMVFVLSPDSVSSEVCAWEISEAARCSKRILPVVCRPVDFAHVPRELSIINAVPFDGFNAVSGLPKLVKALKTDLHWLRQHTRLAERAAEWRAKGEARELLLRGSTLQEAQALVDQRPATAPEITLDQRAYLAAASEAELLLLSAERQRAEELEKAKGEAEAQRDAAKKARDEKAAADARSITRTRIGLAAASLVAIAAVGLGLWANANRLAALEARANADRARALAVRQTENLRLAMLEAMTDPTGVKEAIDFIIEQEIVSEQEYKKRNSAPEWPGGDSGVTIGIGYDVGYASAKDFEADWGSVLPKPAFDRLAVTIGIKGQPARELIEQLKDIEVPLEVARQVFLERTIVRYFRLTQAALPNVSDLPFVCQGALLSLVYNRGPAMGSANDDRRREMRAIRESLVENRPLEIPDQLRSMKRLWPELPGLRDRRDGEARLCENAFKLREKILRQLAAPSKS